MHHVALAPSHLQTLDSCISSVTKCLVVRGANSSGEAARNHVKHIIIVKLSCLVSQISTTLYLMQKTLLESKKANESLILAGAFTELSSTVQTIELSIE